MTPTPINNVDFLRSDAEIGPLTSIEIGGRGGDRIVAVAGGTAIEDGVSVRFWTIVFRMNTGEKWFLGVVSVPSEFPKIAEIGRLQMVSHPLVKSFLLSEGKTSQ